MNTCAECRFWKRRDYNEFTDEPSNWDDMSTSERDTYRNHGICELGESNRHIAVNSASKAIGIDYERLHAQLLTRSDFGCVQFEAKDGVVTVAPRELFYAATPGDKLTLADPLTGIPIGPTVTSET